MIRNKKLFAILTLVCFLFTLMPVAAFASDTGSIYLAGQQITTSGKYVLQDGTWTTTESAVSYVGVDFATKTITLNGANINYTVDEASDCINLQQMYLAAGIYFPDSNWTIKSIETNKIKVTNSYYGGYPNGCPAVMGIVSLSGSVEIISGESSTGKLEIDLTDNGGASVTGSTPVVHMSAGVQAQTISISNCTVEIKQDFPNDANHVGAMGAISAGQSVTIDNATVSAKYDGTSSTRKKR